MADDKSRPAEDRKRVAARERYEFKYFAKKHNLSEADAQRIIKTHGSDRDAADRAAQRFHH